MALRWSSPTLDSFLYDLSRTGTLAGLSDLQQGKGIEFAPYGIGKTKEFYGESPRSWQSAVVRDRVRWSWKPFARSCPVEAVALLGLTSLARSAFDYR
jgi:hypothetical protein